MKRIVLPPAARAAAAIGILLASAASALDEKCRDAVYDGSRRVHQQEARGNRRDCIRGVTSADQNACIDADRPEASDRAEALIGEYDEKCAVLPRFGVNPSVHAIIDAAQAASDGLHYDVWGSLVDPDATDRCHDRISKRSGDLSTAQWKAFRKCVREKEPLADIAGVEACIATGIASGSAEAAERIGDVVGGRKNKCRDPLPRFADGDCGHAPLRNVALCIVDRVECETCLALNRVADANADCTAISGSACSAPTSQACATRGSAENHLINRITFGAVPGDLERVRDIGVDAFLDEQLAPESLDDSALDALLSRLPVATKPDLQRHALLRALRSERQLLEVMTQFWDNHFSTDLNKHGSATYEREENDLFRQHALGRFRDLLAVSAKSPAMLLYLDNASSNRVSPNENYARELLELHTMGVDGGYTQADVEEVARAFTGWTVQSGQFLFDAGAHDTEAKYVLGAHLSASRGIEDGEEVLDLLASHPSTARFICTKLAELFVGDAPPSPLVGRCVTAFVHTGGSITPVVRAVLESPEFADPSSYRAKIKTPLELVVGLLRNLGGSSDGSDLLQPLRSMGMRLFECPLPTGWPESGQDWIDSGQMLQRISFVNRFARGLTLQTNLHLAELLGDGGRGTPDEIVRHLFGLLLDDDFTQTEFDVARNRLTDDGSLAFDIAAPDAETRLRQMVATVLSFSRYQLQ